MTDSETNPWESQDPDAWKQEQVEILPNPELRANLSRSLLDYIDFLSHQNGLDESLGMSDREWIYYAMHVLKMIWSAHASDPGIASKETLEHLEQLIRDGEESSNGVGMIEERVRSEIVEAIKGIQGGLVE
ncbi:MAG: hypothetical protein AAB351_01205 [Patescibacteria group bacterium]